MPAPRPPDEADRIAALRSYDIAGTPPERGFDDLANVAAALFDVPMALVTVVDDDRQWIKADHGFGFRETSRDVSFCAHAILSDHVMVVPDARADPRFAGNPLVTGPPHVRFYAGAPLVTAAGHRIGTVCVLDREPRSFSPEQATLLTAIARQAMTGLELRRTRASRDRERGFLRNIIDTQPSMVFVKDWHGRFVLVNEAVARTYGTTVDGIVGKTDADFNADPAEVEHFVRDDREVMSSRRPKLIPEEPVTNAQGETHWYSTVKVPLVNEDGTCDKLLGVATDISAQKRALTALAESELLHRTMGDMSPGFVWTSTPEGRFEYVNRTWEQFTGSTLDDLNTRGWAQFCHPEELGEVEQRWAAANEAAAPFEMELRFRRHDGVYRWLLSRVVPVKDESGRLIRWVGSATDIEDMKRIEADRRASDERMRQAERLEAVGRLAGGVAHDLNNMLVAILGYSEFVAQSFPEGDERRADVEAIVDAAGRSAKLTRQLLAFARRDLVEPRRFDLNAAVRGAERLLRMSAGETVEVRLSLADEELFTLADPNRIEQVLLNLVLNARDAMPEGGRLSIETSRAVLDVGWIGAHPGVEVVPGEYVRVSVSDTGHGMDHVTLAQAFEPFFTTKPFGRGTGLGLSTAYGSVRQAGGHIAAYSEPGRGSVFRVYLPAAPDTGEAVAMAHPAVETARGRTILVVDDAEPVRTTTARVLVKHGFRCIAVSSGAEALHVLDGGRERVDLVLTDVVMPGMSGRQLAERIAELHPGLPIVFMSGYTEEDILLRGLLDGGRPFIPKPFSPREVVARLSEVLAER